MRLYKLFLLVIFAVGAACDAPEPKNKTPLDALKAYTQAIKKKDTTEMKLLLSEGSLKMAEDEAKAQNVTLDEIIKRETLFTENQSRVEFKNEKIDGDRATIEVKNSYGSWDIVPFNREDGEWKIAKERYLEEQMKKSDEDMRRLDQQINQGAANPALPTPATTLPDMTNPIPAATTTPPATTVNPAASPSAQSDAPLPAATP